MKSNWWRSAVSRSCIDIRYAPGGPRTGGPMELPTVFEELPPKEQQAVTLLLAARPGGDVYWKVDGVGHACYLVRGRTKGGGVIDASYYYFQLRYRHEK